MLVCEFSEQMVAQPDLSGPSAYSRAHPPTPGSGSASCRKMLGVWKQSSIRWLRELVEALRTRHTAAGGSPGSAPVVQWD